MSADPMLGWRIAKCPHCDEELTVHEPDSGERPGLREVTEAEPTLDELWEVVAASLAVAEEHKTAIYRSGDGVPGPEALAGIQKHIAAGLAARVMYERLRSALATPTRDAQSAPAGSEEPREGLPFYETARLIHGGLVPPGADNDPEASIEQVRQAIEAATTPAPDSGAEERLRAALDKADRFVLSHVVPGTAYDHACRECVPGGPMISETWLCAVHEAKERHRAALSGGSIDEGRDSDES